MKHQMKASYKKFLDLLKQVQVNLSLVDILQSVPKYVKYLKDIVVNKKRLTEYATVALTQECMSKIQNKFPMKLKDPGSLTLQITFVKTISTRRLCDLGASINLMPTSWYQKMGLGSPKPTIIILQLANQSLTRPDGIIEDMLVQVGSLIFLVDFVILDFEADAVVLKLTTTYKELSSISVINFAFDWHLLLCDGPLERSLMGHNLYGDVEALELIQAMNLAVIETNKVAIEPLNRPIGPSPKPLVEEAPNLELKVLPSYLQYVFLGDQDTLPVILSSGLADVQNLDRVLA
ncbi:uncharacterized protein LOC124888820 [Capsicum annuum]|uniref:uncharacterized protein LOC124888820 n=1 Tax=Capsicum annuum TaxID=4072 RepID=UPI001FB11701|nr:uncharacterized protein LOC124888820 [Capsicum annuum]